MNIAPLFAEKLPQTKILFKDLLTVLYGSTPLYFDGFEELVLHKLQKHGPFQSWEAWLDQIEEKHRPLFYKLIRGTDHYEVGKIGYPAMGEFFTIANERTKPISFFHARTPILQAAFGKEITQAILKKEQEKEMEGCEHVPLTQTELEALLSQFNFSLTQVKPLLRFVKTTGKTKSLSLSDSNNVVIKDFQKSNSTQVD